MGSSYKIVRSGKDQQFLHFWVRWIALIRPHWDDLLDCWPALDQASRWAGGKIFEGMKMNLIKIVAPILGIAALVFGSLQLATIPMPSPHGLCGEWGWMPETSALVSMHALWTSLILPGMVLLFFNVPQIRITKLWLSLFVILSLVIVVILGVNLSGFLPKYSSLNEITKISLHKLIMMKDIPYLQLSWGCALNFLLCRFWKFS